LPSCSIFRQRSGQSEARAHHVGYCLDFVAIWIADECSIVVRIVIRADAWGAVVLAPGGNSQRVKTAYRFTIRCLKGNMDAVARETGVSRLKTISDAP
jgi:hypothetical protein